MTNELEDNLEELDEPTYDEIVGSFSEDEEEIEEPSIVRRVLLAGVSVAVILGLVYMSGVYQYLFFQRTAPTAPALPVETRLDAETLTIPLTVFITRGSEQYTSVRSEEDVERLVERASEILDQAAVTLSIEEIHTLTKTDEEMRALFTDSTSFVSSVDAVDPTTINVFLTSNLQGINGLALVGRHSIAVADYTTVNDFRVLAHEVGHILGLRHVEGSQGQLMYRGANGISLSSEEMQTARTNAQVYSD